MITKSRAGLSVACTAAAVFMAVRRALAATFAGLRVTILLCGSSSSATTKGLGFELGLDDRFGFGMGFASAVVKGARAKKK